jgi:hypothetical protein
MRNTNLGYWYELVVAIFEIKLHIFDNIAIEIALHDNQDQASECHSWDILYECETIRDENIALRLGLRETDSNFQADLRSKQAARAFPRGTMRQTETSSCRHSGSQ